MSLRAMLGLATTKELLAELEARLDSEYGKRNGITESYEREVLFDMISLCERAQAGLPDDILNYRTIDE